MVSVQWPMTKSQSFKEPVPLGCELHKFPHFIFLFLGRDSVAGVGWRELVPSPTRQLWMVGAGCLPLLGQALLMPLLAVGCWLCVPQGQTLL